MSGYADVLASATAEVKRLSEHLTAILDTAEPAMRDHYRLFVEPRYRAGESSDNATDGYGEFFDAVADLESLAGQVERIAREECNRLFDLGSVQ